MAIPRRLGASRRLEIARSCVYEIFGGYINNYENSSKFSLERTQFIPDASFSEYISVG